MPFVWVRGPRVASPTRLQAGREGPGYILLVGPMNRKLLVLAWAMVAVFAAPPKSEPQLAVTVVRVPHGGIQPQVVMGPRGILHLLYFAGDPKAGDLFYVKSADYGATWSRAVRVNSTPGSAVALGTIRGGQIAIGRNGRVHVAWNGSSAVPAGRQRAPMLYSRSSTDGARFDRERNLMTRTFGLDGGGAITADSAGNVFVAWHGKAAGAAQGETGRQVWIAASHDDGTTFAAERPAWTEPTGACGCCGMALCADSKGALRVLYRSATGGIHRDIVLLTSFDRGRTYTGRRLHKWEINACPMSSMALSEGAGNVAGAWETGGQVYFEDLTRTNAIPVSAPGEGKGRKHPRLAIAANGEILMVWTEKTGWQHGGSLAWQRFAPDGTALGEVHTEAGVPAWSFGAVAAKPDGFVILF